MSLFARRNATAIDQKQNRLIQLAAGFLFLFSLALTLAPAVRLHSWDVTFRWNHWIGFFVWTLGAAAAHNQLARHIPDRDPFIFPIVSLLSGWGLLTIWRLDPGMGLRQTIWLGICSAVLVIGLQIPGFLHALRRYKYLWLTCGLLLTGLTFLFGTYPGGNGPHLWLGCCGIYLQPSEPLKLLLIVYLAAYLANRLPLSFNLAQLLTPTLIMSSIALAMLAIQRDLGTASLFILIYSVIIYLASQRKRMLVVSLLILLGSGVLGYILFDVVRIRIDAWMNPWRDPSGRSYQIVQSLLAVASGGLIGRGPGLGSPGIVPVAHSDFIFASITEETGLLGACALIGLYALLVGRGFHMALRAVNNYQRYLAAGISAYLSMQGIFIIGGNLRLLPLTGVTLPFVSYGGSSLLTAYLSCLILILISNRGEEEPAPLNKPMPYLLISGGLLASLLVLALGAGWWAIVRSDDLLSRTDNPRRGISDRYVQRGSIIDRNSIPIVQTTGSPGDYQRLYEYPPLGLTTGYNNPLYGQAGLEAGLDGYLRGLKGNPSSLIWFDHLLYGQPPPGLDTQLTLDLELQKKADELLGEHRGALVLLNAATGEILAIASHPYYDPNQIGTDWLNLIQDPGSPLLNRATLGQYSPGTALGPFLLTFAAAQGPLPVLPGDTSYTNHLGTTQCAIEPSLPLFPGKLIANGCPAAVVTLGETIGAEKIKQIYTSLGFLDTPDLPLEVARSQDSTVVDAKLAAIGLENLKVTPLQMAVAAATLTNEGKRPSPKILSAVLTSQQGWVTLPNQPGIDTVFSKGIDEILDSLAAQSPRTWETTAVSQINGPGYTWFISGSLPQASKKPLALALILEENQAQLAKQIGRSLMNAALEQ
ncbi:MAG: FtsW/RodA/SpoVE family cell cycle protein [Anaerolineaceae bacterium]|nr:FtsW/RodA/SpoVE family cell cycle protein [Anaerolineaceae bacterium]